MGYVREWLCQRREACVYVYVNLITRCSWFFSFSFFFVPVILSFTLEATNVYDYGCRDITLRSTIPRKKKVDQVSCNISSR